MESNRDRPFATLGKSIAGAGETASTVSNPQTHDRTGNGSLASTISSQGRSNTGTLNQAQQKRCVLPALQPRLTAFHGTRVPIIIIFFLSPTQARTLSRCDHFWKRILGYTVIWKGLHCRDFYTEGCGGENLPLSCRRCVWVQMMGRSGRERCLWHLALKDGPEFAQVCQRIAAIPGRSKKELLESYQTWMKNRLRSKDGDSAPAAAGAPEKLSQDPAWEHPEAPTFGRKPPWEKYSNTMPNWKDWSRAMGFPSGPHRQARVEALTNNAVGPMLDSYQHSFKATNAHCHSLSFRHDSSRGWTTM